MTPVDQAPQAAASSVRRVLLVDDEPDIQTIARLSLECVGAWQALLACSGSDAIAMAAREKPDLILLDVMMPDMDGPTTLAQLREDPATAGIPVIFMTAKAQKHEVERFLRMGALGVITKPFDPMTLPTQIRDILATRD